MKGELTLKEWTREAVTISELRINGRIASDEGGYHLYWPLSGAKFQYSGQDLLVQITSEAQVFPIYMAVLVDRKPVWAVDGIKSIGHTVPTEVEMEQAVAVVAVANESMDAQV